MNSMTSTIQIEQMSREEKLRTMERLYGRIYQVLKLNLSLLLSRKQF